jgi:MYXO-CTERM domain-containing protein
MVPLLLTAVAADPHMTVTSYLYADESFRAMGHPQVTIDPTKLASDKTGRTNYPMVLARAVADAGGDGFAVEYRGAGVRPTFGSMGNCCGNPSDFCNLGGNNKCECPADAFDASDCASQGDIVDGVKLVDDLATKYTHLTRITTRVSPEDMRFDPTYERDYGAQQTGRLVLRGKQASLDACESAVIDKGAFAQIEALEGCSTMYCGGSGQCVSTAAGAACACTGDTVAQRFIDLDGQPSVTCVPRVPTVDLRAGGQVLPDACASVSCGAGGSCIDRNGVAVCQCSAGFAARAGTGTAPHCDQIQESSESPGGADYSDSLRDLAVCAPPPPTCGTNGWLVRTGKTTGVDCGGTEPPAWKTQPGPKPFCAGWFGCGCQQGADPLPTIGLAWVVAAMLARRRRRPRA